MVAHRLPLSRTQRVPAQRIWNFKHTQSKQAAVEAVNPPIMVAASTVLCGAATIIENIVHGEGEFCKQNMWLKDGPNGVKGNGNKAAVHCAAA